MSPVKKRVKQCREASLKSAMDRWEQKRGLDPMELAFSVIVSGTTPKVAWNLFRWNRIRLPGKSWFYECQKKVCEEIIKMARESMEKVQQELGNETKISFDGSWDHRRHGSRCVLKVIDCESKNYAAGPKPIM